MGWLRSDSEMKNANAKWKMENDTPTILHFPRCITGSRLLAPRPLKAVRAHVGLDHLALALGAFGGVPVFHPEHEVAAGLLHPGMNVLEDILVVRLTGAGLFAAGHVPDLEVRDLVPRGVDVRDEMSLVPLHVVDVVEDLARGAVDGAADRVRLI